MKQSVSPVVIGIAVVVVLAVIGIVGWKLFAPPPKGHINGGTGNSAYDDYQKTGKMPASGYPGAK